MACQEQGNPAAHARPHEHRGASLERSRANRLGLCEPCADGAVLEPSAGFAMAGVVEPQASGAVLPRPIAERARLDAFHRRPEAAEPDKYRLVCLRFLKAVGDGHGWPGLRAGHEHLQFLAVHLMLPFYDTKRCAGPMLKRMPWPVILQIVPELSAGGAERTTIEMAEAVTLAGGRALVVSSGGRLEDELAKPAAS